MAIRAVVFDLFDTLVDLSMEDLPRIEVEGRQLPSTAGVLHQTVGSCGRIDFDAFFATLRQVDLEFRDSHYAVGRELPTVERFTELVRRLGLDDDELPARLTDVHMGMIRDLVTVPGHHADLLGELAGRVRLGLCSNFSHSETALRILEEAGLRRHLHAVVISDAVGLRKPRAEIFEAVLAELGVSAGETLHVGDSLRADVGGGTAAGMRTAWITRRIADPERRLEEHDGPRPHHRIRDLAELPGLLEL
jgi:FMN phosphatase YigB (HAD superfamily)